MKRDFITQILVASALLSVVVASTGCNIKSKKEKEAEAAAKNATEQAVKESAVQVKLEQTEAQKIDLAMKDLDDKLIIYKAIAGDFEGYYLRMDKQKTTIKVGIAINNLPPAYNKTHRPVKEGDVLAQIEALNLDVSVDEFWIDPQTKVKSRAVSCKVTTIKPDLASGIMRLNCTAGTSTRYYFLGLDRVDSDFETTEDLDMLEHRTKNVSDELVQGKIKSIEGMNLRIEASYLDFAGKLWRK